ncbi:MAG: S-layer homology domain-containing protein [Oscillospiraceae bacterium]|nr:S-layer homology domain-containing protein [Oscillospiraceae bacterium]
MRWAVGAGIVNGGEGMLEPNNNATRAQVAQIVLNCESVRK